MPGKSEQVDMDNHSNSRRKCKKESVVRLQHHIRIPETNGNKGKGGRDLRSAMSCAKSKTGARKAQRHCSAAAPERVVNGGGRLVE